MTNTPLLVSVAALTVPPALMQLPWWLDFLKTLLATFMGAGLAFIANQLAVKLKERTERETNGNLAVLKLGLMIGNCHDLERTIADHRGKLLARVGSEELFLGLPLWMRTFGLTHMVETDVSFDFEKLFFLLDDNQNSLLSLLYLSAQKHRLLFTTITEFREIRRKAEERLEGARLGTWVTPEQINEVVGPRIGAELHDIAESIDSQLADVRPYMETTSNDLSRALKKHFAEENWFMRLLALLRLVRRIRPKKTPTPDPEATHSR